MKINQITFSNLLSYGNKRNIVQFDDDKKLIGITGQNGQGKSSVLDAICFALYGNPFRKINKPDLINRINDKELYVKVEFENRGNNWIIERGISPNFIKVYRDDEEIQLEAHSYDIQKYINSVVIGLNENVFRQLIMVAMRNFKSFFSLPRDKRRELFESVINISVLSNMKKKFQVKISELEKILSKNTLSISFTEDKITNLKKQLQKIEQLSLDSIIPLQQQIEQLDKQVETLQRSNSKYEPLSQLEKQYQQLSKQTHNLEFKSEEITKNIKKCKEELTFFQKNDKCPRCKHILSDKEKQSQKKYLTTSIVTFESELECLNKQYNELTDQQSAISDTIKTIKHNDIKIQEYTLNKKSLTQQITDIQSTSTNNQLKDEIESQLNDATQQLNTLITDKEQHESNLDIINTFKHILSDEGLKKFIYMNFLPILNTYVNNILHSFEMNIKFTLEENLDEKIYTKTGEILKFDTFSSGEQQLIDISFMFGLHQFLEKINNFHNDTLFIDELFDASIDAENLDKIISYMKNDIDKQIIIISHKTSVKEYFDSSFFIKKDGNFSQIYKED